MTDIETQDTEPLTPDAARIVELERRIVQLELRLEVEVRANDSALRLAAAHSGVLQGQLDRQKPVMQAALEAGRYFLAHETMDLDDGDYRRLETLGEAVRTFDALQPKG
jgi:hypothetical protein